MNAFDLTRIVHQTAHTLGFDLCRIVPIEEARHADFFDAWHAAGRAGEMGYLTRHADKRRRPALLDADGSLRSLIVLAVDYRQRLPTPVLRDDPSRGLIASYAWGDDYHEVLKPLLHELDAELRRHSGRRTPGKCLVDTGPVLERDWAHRAGIGFTGKNCCTIRPGVGSWLFLATLLVPETLIYDPAPRGRWPRLGVDDLLAGLPAADDFGAWTFVENDGPPKTGACGRCTRCLAACPTEAFVGPFHLDPARCIAYWTIEARGPIPASLRPHFGNRIFGCDVCQEVCPWNSRLPEREPRLAPLRAHADRIAPPLLEGFAAPLPYWLNDEAFRLRFRRSPVKRAKRTGMLRNVCIALGNWAAPMALPALQQALIEPEPVVRSHAAWAIGRVRQSHHVEAAQAVLEEALNQEQNDMVRAELSTALQTKG